MGGKIYVTGGSNQGSSVNSVYVYDPQADAWTQLASMGTARKGHASAAVEGKLYVFGGRQGGNFPQPGFNTVQVYDPATDTWDSSSLGGSTLAPMPLGRGGTGKAVYFFGMFYVMGGESNSAVFDQVLVYDPLGNSWRTEVDMITARHGIFPIRYQRSILVAGGGTNAGFSASAVLETYTHP